MQLEREPPTWISLKLCREFYYRAVGPHVFITECINILTKTIQQLLFCTMERAEGSGVRGQRSNITSRESVPKRPLECIAWRFCLPMNMEDVCGKVGCVRKHKERGWLTGLYAAHQAALLLYSHWPHLMCVSPEKLLTQPQRLTPVRSVFFHVGDSHVSSFHLISVSILFINFVLVFEHF